MQVISVDSSKNRLRYIAKINRAIDFIENNLDQELTLDQVARFSGFSEYHFHRIFSSIVGETFGRFVQRIRIERSAMLLYNHPHRTVTDIAFSCGFASSASYARLFREYFDCTPTMWRDPKFENSKNSIGLSRNYHIDSSLRKDIQITSRYNRDTNGFEWIVFLREKEFSRIRVETMEEREIAYVRYIGPYMGDVDLFRSLYDRILKWAASRKLMNRHTRSYCIYHDDPAITEAEKLRVSVGIDIPPGTEVSGETGKLVLPGGEYAIAYFELDSSEYLDAWQVICSDWFPESGYMFGDGLPFEMPLCDPRDHPQGKHLVEICIPVVPL